MMKLVVVRKDGFLVLCDCSRKNAESLLEKYSNISRKKRTKWLRQHGNVYYVRYYFALDKPLVGVYTPEEFLKKYEEYVDNFVKESMDAMEKYPNRRREFKYRITLIKKELERIREFLSTKIEKVKLERRKREKHAVKLVEVSEELYGYAEYTSRSRCEVENGELFFFTNTFWVYTDEEALVVRLDVPDEAVFDGLAKLVEEKPEDMEVIRDVLAEVSGSKCRVPDDVKDRLGTVSTFLSMLLA